MKKFLKSKKALVAAALAAILAMGGVTYAWFSWTTGVSGGQVGMGKIQVEAEFGMWTSLDKQHGDAYNSFLPLKFFSETPDVDAFRAYCQAHKYIEDSTQSGDETLEGNTLYEVLKLVEYTDNDLYDELKGIYDNLMRQMPSGEMSNVGYRIYNLGGPCYVDFSDFDQATMDNKNYGWYIAGQDPATVAAIEALGYTGNSLSKLLRNPINTNWRDNDYLQTRLAAPSYPTKGFTIAKINEAYWYDAGLIYTAGNIINPNITRPAAPDKDWEIRIASDPNSTAFSTTYDANTSSMDIQLLTYDVTNGGIAANDGKVLLYIDGTEYTYDTNKEHPIDVPMSVQFGKYLDNRFQGSIIDFSNALVEAVQLNDEAVEDVFGIADFVNENGTPAWVQAYKVIN